MSDSTHSNLPPSEATNAVLVPSAELPQGVQKVEEIDFNDFKGKQITVDDVIQRMSHVGFQATSMGEAVRIINDMVSATRTNPVSQDKHVRK